MNLVVLISGQGTNCQEILKHKQLFGYNVSLIVSNRGDGKFFNEYCANKENNCNFF